MYYMTHGCFYPACSWSLSCYESHLHDLGITKNKRDQKGLFRRESSELFYYPRTKMINRML